jgi:predicted enzyme related to lactoylglutathione lyase
MGNPVVHFEIIGKDPAKLRSYYSALFGWELDTNSPVAEAVSQAGNYGFTNPPPGSGGIPGGVGGGQSFESHALFYVGVPEVETALRKAESLGGKRRMNPSPRPDGKIVVAQFTDPEGNLVGLAGPK